MRTILMLRYIPIFLICVASPGLITAQNLVTNPGFEELYKCPNGRGEIIPLPIYRDFPTVLDWISPLNTSPDYFNTCATDQEVKLPNTSLDGYHHAHGGDGCAGISMFTGKPYADTTDYWAEYLETRLSTPMEAGHVYYISYYVCLTYHDRVSYNIIAVDNIGARLTTQMIDTYSAGPMFFLKGPPDIQTPPGLFISDTINWVMVSGVYHAGGGEQWLTIGRFYTDTINFRFLYTPAANLNMRSALDQIHSSCYMLVDDVCVTDMNKPYTSDTTLYTPQFPVSIGLGKQPGQNEWNNGDTSTQIEISEPGIYVRKRWRECGYYIDSFKVVEAPIDFCVWLPNAFTPNGDGRNDKFGPGDSYCHFDFSDYSFNIYNRFGQLVFQSVNPGEKWDGRPRSRP